MGGPRQLAPVWPALAALLLVALFLTPIRNLDLWWHLDAGRWMLAQHAYLDREIRSFTMPDAHWPNFAWLFQVTVAAVHALGGAWGLLAFKAMLWWGILFLLFRAIGDRGAPFAWLLPVAAFGWQLTPIMHLRPHLLEGLFLAATVLLLQRPRSRRRYWLSALLVLLWANTHASVVVGAAALGLHWLLGPTFAWPGWRELGRRLPGALLLGALVFATPNGLGILDVLFGHARADYLAAYIREWLPPKGLPPFLFLGLAAIPLVLMLRRRLLTPGELLLVAVFLGLAASNKRFLYELALVLVRPTGVLLGLGLERLGRRFPHLAGAHGWQAGALVLAALWLAYPPPWPWLEHRPADYPVMLRRFPHVALAALRPALAGERPLRVWNRYGWGGWLGWAGEGRIRIYIDGRTPTVFTEELMLQAHLAKRRPAMLRALLDGWEVDAVVLKRGRRPPLPVDDPRWLLVAYDAESLAYLRADLVARFGLLALPYDPFQSIAHLDPERRDAAERALRALLGRDPLNPLGWRHLAELLALRADAETPAVLDEIGRLLRRSLAQDPDQPMTRIRLVQWLDQTGAAPARAIEPLLPWALQADGEKLARQEPAIARQLLAHDRPEAALAVLRTRDPRRQQQLNELPEVWRLRALALVRTGDLQRARRARDLAAWLVLDAPPAEQAKQAAFLERLERALQARRP